MVNKDTGYPVFEEEKKASVRMSSWLGVIVIIGSFVACLVMFFLVTFARAEYSNDQIANAIYKAENSVKYPYGIKSIPTYGNKEYARKICLNTIRNNRVRFAKQNKYSDFIEFLGSRYCPTTIKSEYQLNKNWVRNVKKFLEREA